MPMRREPLHRGRARRQDARFPGTKRRRCSAQDRLARIRQGRSGGRLALSSAESLGGSQICQEGDQLRRPLNPSGFPADRRQHHLKPIEPGCGLAPTQRAIEPTVLLRRAGNRWKIRRPHNSESLLSANRPERRGRDKDSFRQERLLKPNEQSLLFQRLQKLALANPRERKNRLG